MPPKKRLPKGEVLEMKIVFVGSSGVGKTSIMHRFTQNSFSDSTEVTIGTSYVAKEVTIDETKLKYSLWDTAGQEQYHSLVPHYFRQAGAVILVYDITSRASFEGARNWVSQIHSHAPSDVIIALVGNKSDRLEYKDVDDDLAETYAQSIEALHCLVSAKSGSGVSDLFEQLGRKFLERRSMNKPSISPLISSPSPTAASPVSPSVFLNDRTSPATESRQEKPQSRSCCG